MADLGFYADIQGTKYFLAKDKNKAWDLIMGLTEDIITLCRAISSTKDNIGRFLGYQMADGFFMHFDNITNEYGDCRGKSIDMVMLAVVLAQHFLIRRRGILRVGLAKGEVSGHSTSHLDERNCGASVLHLVPVIGTLLANAYPLTTITISSRSEHDEPRIWIHSNILDSLEAIQSDLEEVKHNDSSQLQIWAYKKSSQPTDEIKELYKKIWSEEITAEIYSDAVKKYNDEKAENSYRD